MPVYMIQAGNDGPVKIGRATAPEQRLKHFQLSHYLPLHLIRVVVGEYQLEQWFHREFSENHLLGEWFSFVPRMLTISPPDFLKREKVVASDKRSIVGGTISLSEMVSLLHDAASRNLTIAQASEVYGISRFVLYRAAKKEGVRLADGHRVPHLRAQSLHRNEEMLGFLMSHSYADTAIAFGVTHQCVGGIARRNGIRRGKENRILSSATVVKLSSFAEAAAERSRIRAADRWLADYEAARKEDQDRRLAAILGRERLEGFSVREMGKRHGVSPNAASRLIRRYFPALTMPRPSTLRTAGECAPAELARQLAASRQWAETT